MCEFGLFHLLQDAAALLVLLHKYELELRSPKLHNLHNLLQTSGSENTQINVSVTDSERTEHRRETPSVSEEREICTGCGVVLVPEDAPYLEILGIGEKRDDVRREREEEERRGGGREREEEERRGGREGEEEERRGGREGEEEERRGGREGEEEERRGGREEEEKKNVDAVEKQGSLITLAWSKPASNNTQEVTSALPEARATEATSADSHTPDHTHSGLSQHEHTPRAQAHTLVEPLQEQSTSSMVLLSLLRLHSSFLLPFTPPALFL
ncbi:cyclic nucleotide-gated cation channel beta-1-like [Ictalurus furcatus]|uniref:cyclic nucleotide-gated cation channel beta-1-like n=1 Tax=Ictalurus furcatus TaxID=66913 RepID=UPI002350A9AD|nr:cyclic nucleotide-gated cation channel beta-1-like [Ictalurus furcatus]